MIPFITAYEPRAARVAPEKAITPIALPRVPYRGAMETRMAKTKRQERAVESGVDVDLIKRMALECRNWNQFDHWLTRAIDEASE